MTTSVAEGTRDERGTKRESFFCSRAADLVSRVSRHSRARSLPKGDITRDDSQLFAVYANFACHKSPSNSTRPQLKG